jgi:hypothetical protein
MKKGRATVQAVSGRLPTAAARVQAQFGSFGICGGKSGSGAGFLREFCFPLPILISPTAPHSSSCIILGWYNRPNCGRLTKWMQTHPTPPHPTPKYTSISVASSDILLGLQSGVFYSSFQTEVSMNLSPLPCELYSLPILTSLICSP